MTIDITAGALASGARKVALDKRDIKRIEVALRLSGIPDANLSNRLSVVFVYPGMGVGEVYPEMAGCTTEVCAFIEESAMFERHGIQVIGLSTEPSEAPPGCLAIPFSTGVLPEQGIEPPIEFVDKADKRYAVRASFIIGPDGHGLKITDIEDVVAHVRLCFRIAMDKRLTRYADAAVDYLRRGSEGFRPNVTLRGLLANGADSVAIARIDVTLPLVSKLADRAIITQEAGYIRRINQLLVDNRQPELFPTVLAICDSEDPAWYLMEAADPTKLDEIVFADDARTVLSDSGKTLVHTALDKLIALYRLTRTAETPAVARYHYLERFLQLPERTDFRNTFELLVRGDIEQTLTSPVSLGNGYECDSYQDQMRFLSSSVDTLLPNFGAYLHGDAHLPNMLLAKDGSDVLFIDPRVVWDGHNVGQPGFGDPLYDLGTLLHSLHAMSSILHAIETGSSEDLIHISDAASRVIVEPGKLHLLANPTVCQFLAYIEEKFPSELLGSRWRTRLHVNAANAFVGWLKYSRAIQTASAWWAVFAAAMYHLEEARRQTQEGTA